MFMKYTDPAGKDLRHGLSLEFNDIEKAQVIFFPLSLDSLTEGIPEWTDRHDHRHIHCHGFNCDRVSRTSEAVTTSQVPAMSLYGDSAK